jgi:hypothetical protein
MKYLFKAETQEEYEEFVSNMAANTPYVVSSNSGVEYYFYKPIVNPPIKNR